MAWNKGYSFGIGEERPFNFAQLLLERLNDLFKAANEARYIGDAFKWFNALNSIASSISFKLTNAQAKTIKKNLQSIRNKMKQANNINNELFFLNVELALNDFEIKLVKHMFEYGLYQNKSWEETIEAEDI